MPRQERIAQFFGVAVNVDPAKTTAAHKFSMVRITENPNPQAVSISVSKIFPQPSVCFVLTSDAAERCHDVWVLVHVVQVRGVLFTQWGPNQPFSP
jgi:hypothetical protein